MQIGRLRNIIPLEWIRLNRRERILRFLARRATRWECAGPLTAALLTAGLALAAPPPTVDSAGFDAKVKPILKNTCSGCHNASVMSGGVNLAALSGRVHGRSRTGRPGRRSSQKIESGEMPPEGHSASAAGADDRADEFHPRRVRQSRCAGETRSRPRHRASA